MIGYNILYVKEIYYYLILTFFNVMEILMLKIKCIILELKVHYI